MQGKCLIFLLIILFFSCVSNNKPQRRREVQNQKKSFIADSSSSHILTIEDREQILIAKFDSNEELSSKLYTKESELWDSPDSVDNMNDSIAAYFLSILKTKEAVTYSFDSLKQVQSVSFAESPDKKLRLFSWDVWDGGMDFPNATAIAQYVDGTRIYAKDIGMEVSFDTIYQINSLNGVYYIALGSVRNSGRWYVGKQATFFYIGKSWLCNRGRVDDNICFTTQRISYSINNLLIEWEPDYIVDIKNKKLFEPIVDGKSKIRHKRYKTYAIE